MSYAAQRTISLRDANQGFAKMVKEVESGATFTLTRNGEPVATIQPVKQAVRKLTPDQERILAKMNETAEGGFFKKPWKFNRDELYDR